MAFPGTCNSRGRELGAPTWGLRAGGTANRRRRRCKGPPPNDLDARRTFLQFGGRALGRLADPEPGGVVAGKKDNRPFSWPRIAGTICALQIPHPDICLLSSLSLSQVP